MIFPYISMEQFAGYENKWVALAGPDRQKIVGSGNDPSEAIKDARKNGYTETTLLAVPRFDGYHIPTPLSSRSVD